MNEDARTKSAFSTVEACRSVFKLDYHQLTEIVKNVEAFDACGKIILMARSLVPEPT